jgi:putative ABC transport system permease protein
MTVVLLKKKTMVITTLHRHFIFRQIVRSRRQAMMFVMCVALSIVTLIALNGFSASVHKSLLNDARMLHAADIIVRSNYEFPPALNAAVKELEKKDRVTSARVYEFYSVVRTADDRDSLLARLKVVQKGYPFYGRIELQSGEEFKAKLVPGRIIVSQPVLDQLKVNIGDQLHVGEALMTIEDVVIQEPDQPVSLYFLGLRIFIASEDLGKLNLLTHRSRVRHIQLLKVHDESSIRGIADQLNALVDREQVTVNTFQTAESGVKRFFDNFLFFLALIGIFTLLLAGFGIQSTLSAFLKEKEKTIAVMKMVGAKSAYFTRHFVIILSVLGFLGTVLGLLLGFVLQHVLHVLFTGLLPPSVRLTISIGSIIEGLILGVLVVGLFSYIPLHRLKEIKPLAILQKIPIRSKKSLPYLSTALIIFVFFIAMILWRLNDMRMGFYFVIGILLLILITSLSAEVVFILMKKLRFRSLVVRQAIRGLFRPRNATKPIIITLTASLTVIFSIYLIEQNLDATYIQSYPPDAPNLFLLDIQPSQRDEFSQALGMETEYYPIIRARITAINEDKIDRKKERQRRGDNLGRTFNLTYRGYLLKDEVIVSGETLFREDWGELQVSILDTVSEIRKMTIGDTITFNIQGVPLEAKISSIRSRTRETLRPYFYFVFPEKTLQQAPQTVFTAVKVANDDVTGLQTKIAKEFPNVSAINVTQTLATFAGVLRKLSLIIRFFTLFSIVAGVLIIISSILATRYARIQEAVYYKILGAKSIFVLKVFSMENLFLGLISAGLALLLSQIGSWIICSFILDISYAPFVGNSILLVVGTLALVLSVGLLPSRAILRKKPIAFLREQTQE